MFKQGRNTKNHPKLCEGLGDMIADGPDLFLAPM